MDIRLCLTTEGFSLTYPVIYWMEAKMDLFVFENMDPLTDSDLSLVSRWYKALFFRNDYESLYISGSL